jgi:hypothetical protein
MIKAQQRLVLLLLALKFLWQAPQVGATTQAAAAAAAAKTGTLSFAAGLHAALSGCCACLHAAVEPH